MHGFATKIKMSVQKNRSILQNKNQNVQRLNKIYESFLKALFKLYFLKVKSYI